MGIFTKLSYISRSRKLQLFSTLFQPTREMHVLDVGAETGGDGAFGLKFIDWYPWKENLVALNCSAEHIKRIKQRYPQVKAVVGDACELPWNDKHFDIVYSNAVIEHVGDFERQKKMAAEIMRTGKRWFVTTPNRWYPFEFHLRLPFVTWLPGRSYAWIGTIVRYDHVRRKYVMGAKPSNTRLLSARQMRECFAKSKVIKQRVTFLAETLIAVGGDNLDVN